MNTCKLWISLLLVGALLLPAGMALGQSRMAQIEDAKRLLEDNPTFNNRLRLGTLQYLEGVDYLGAGDLDNAIDLMQAGVWTLEDGAGLIPETHPVFEEARYGLGYALLQNDNPYEALLVLDQLVNASPTFDKARYLLGVTLINIPGSKSMQRGVDVMRALAVDGREPYKTWAQRAATRFAYNLSTLDHARGNAEEATATLTDVIADIGADKGASEDENNMVQFAMGVYQRDQGDLFGALDNFEPLYASAPGFRTSTGTTLQEVLENTYYFAGVEQLELGGFSAASLALNLFESTESVAQDPDALDIHHGKAVAYTRLGEEDNAVEEIRAIIRIDESYYERIKQ